MSRAALISLIVLLAGCAGVPPEPGSDAEAVTTVHAVTAYDSRFTPQEDRGQGPAAGSPAVGGALLVVLVDPGRPDAWRTQREDPLYDPARPPEVENGALLSLGHEAFRRYLLPLDAGGEAWFTLREDVLVSLEVHGGDATGAACPAWLVPATPVEAAADDVRLTVPFGIRCRE